MAFVALEKLSVMRDGYKKRFRVGQLDVLLLQEQGDVYLIENKCPHMDVSLDTADLLLDSAIRCRAHGIEFDLASGRAKGPLSDTLACLKKYKVIYDGSYLGMDTAAA